MNRKRNMKPGEAREFLCEQLRRIVRLPAGEIKANDTTAGHLDLGKLLGTRDGKVTGGPHQVDRSSFQYHLASALVPLPDKHKTHLAGQSLGQERATAEWNSRPKTARNGFSAARENRAKSRVRESIPEYTAYPRGTHRIGLPRIFFIFFRCPGAPVHIEHGLLRFAKRLNQAAEIGRASCRERV